ncbi:MAG TPA: magnesium transporter [Candidatus Woesebacteria bacterium]|nr:magnesium transporter [Candidatus Woesebacteria bacterium]
MNMQLRKKVTNLLQQYKYDDINKFLIKHDFHDIAHVLNHIKSSQLRIFTDLPPEIQAVVILQLTDRSKRIILPEMSVASIARFLNFNDDDDATETIQFLLPEKRISILEKLQENKRKKIERLLKFGKETAGRIMDLDYIIVKDTFTFQDIAEKVQAHIDRENKVPFIILAEESGKILGYIPHKNIMFSSRRSTPKELAEPLPVIKHSLDQKRILKNLKNLKTETVGVIDDNEKVIGIIPIRELLRIAQAKATQDIYGFAGVEKEETPDDPIWSKVNKRYKWLIINLATAFLASSVVGLFENTISQLALLAVYMPMVAGEGGNAATQSLAVVVRGLAVDDISWEEARGIIFKESFAGLLNGVIVGAVSALTAYIFHAPIMLGIVLGIAMIVNLFFAGFSGALIPFILKSFKIDPAVASSVFVTTVTDIIGFFVFLGLGTLLLL